MKKLTTRVVLLLAAAVAVAVPVQAAGAAPTAPDGDVIRTWNGLALDAARAGVLTDAQAARLYAMVNVAMYDAVNGVAPPPRRRQAALVAPRPASGGDAVTAAAGAAHGVLSALHAGGAARYDQQLEADMAASEAPGQAERGREWGAAVAAEVLAARADDGSSPAETLFPPHNPPAIGEFHRSWSQTQFRNLRPFAIADPSAYVGAAPPALTSAEYTAAFNQVKHLGSEATVDPTADAIFSFWRLDGGTSQPPGAWLQITSQATEIEELPLPDTARLFALEAMALADAVAPTYATKATHWFWRPATAINAAENDGNPDTEPAEGTWAARARSVGSSPEYYSGHSTFSAAGAAVLAGFFCRDDFHFTLASDSTPNAPRSFSSFSQAASEAGFSRILGGFHFSFSNQRALAAGRDIAREVLATSLLPLTGPTHVDGCPV